MTLRHRSRPTVIPAPVPPDFSLVHGGPLFRLSQKTHLCGPSLELLHRRVLAVALFTWLPLLLFSLLDGSAFAGTVKVPFLSDVETHVRLLVCLPLLFVAEVLVEVRISPLIRNFVDRRIVTSADLPAFNAAVRSAMRTYDSPGLELGLLVVVYVLGPWLWRTHIAFDASTWYAQPVGGHLDVSTAGYWNAFVSIPIFQFLLLRWYARIAVWFRLLWRISRLNLHLNAGHPDRAGGIGFLGKSTYAFAPILLAQGALLSGVVATRVLYSGESPTSFTVEAVTMIGALVLFMLGPLVMFTPHLDRARRRGRGAYGVLASRYVAAFEEKWIRRGGMEESDLLGSSDIQSLADMGNSYQVVNGMRLVPFVWDDVVRLVAVTAAPLVPLSLTVYPLHEVVTRLVKILF